VTLEGYLNWAVWLFGLGIKLYNRYKKTGAMADLNNTIRIIQEAVNTTIEDNIDCAQQLNGLAGGFYDRYLSRDPIN
jgi:hypothetical protein